MDSNTDKTDDRHFFVDAVNKSIHNAMLNHNTTFLNTFHNTIKDAFYGFPLDQVGPAYYNIPHPSTQGTNHVSTSQQGAALAKDDDIQAVQNSSKQVQDSTTNQMQYNPRSSVQHVQHRQGKF
jgi:DNA-directed RNA polymerase subunit L